jgi:hypothetical protein
MCILCPEAAQAMLFWIAVYTDTWCHTACSGLGSLYSGDSLSQKNMDSFPNRRPLLCLFCFGNCPQCHINHFLTLLPSCLCSLHSPWVEPILFPYKGVDKAASFWNHCGKNPFIVSFCSQRPHTSLSPWPLLASHTLFTSISFYSLWFCVPLIKTWCDCIQPQVPESWTCLNHNSACHRQAPHPPLFSPMFCALIGQSLRAALLAPCLVAPSWV